ncbi:MAG TPA: YfhO family protein [Ferruginibacter sp.]|nr:YfhO family protein [Ferruginibacter sp.]
MSAKKKSTPAKKGPANDPTPELPDLFERAGNKGILIALALILFISFIVFKDFILLHKVYLYKDIGSDTVNAGYPYFYSYARYFSKYGLPSWSFQEGMGQNILGGFLRDPFMLIGYMLGSSYMPKIFVFTEILKIISGGAIFYLFLKQLKVSTFSAIIGTLLFSFSGFMIIGSAWYVFTYEAFTLALVLLGFELYFQKNNWIVFVIAIFSIGISMPFDLYITGLFLFFYILFRLAQTGQLNVKMVVSILLKLCLLGIVGLLLSAPFLSESLLQIAESPRGGSSSYFNMLSSQPVFALADQFQFGTFVMRFFSSNLIGVGNDFKGWINYLEAPMSYCGIISIILMPQVFSFISKSARKWYIIWLLIWLLPNIFPYLRHALWLFTGEYYRVLSFCLSLVFILYAVWALDLIIKNKKLNLITLAVTLLICILLLNFNYFDEGSVEKDQMVMFFIYVSIFVYSLLLIFITRPGSSAYFKYALLVFVCIELIFMSAPAVNDRQAFTTDELTQKTAYNDYSVEAVNYIKSNEKGFYRIDKDYFSSGSLFNKSLNDNKMLDYNGTSAYSAFSNGNYINYLRAYEVIGYNELDSRWCPGLIGRPFLQSLNQVKYILIKNYSNPIWRYVADSVAKFGDVIVLKNKFTLPFGYTYQQYMLKSEFDSLSIWQKDVLSYKACVLTDAEVNKANGLKPYDIKDSVDRKAYTFEMLHNDVAMLSSDTLQLSFLSDKKITGQVVSRAPEIMYLSFPYDRGWHLTVDGKETELINLNGMTGLYLMQGTHQVELNYRVPLFFKALWFMLAGILFCIVLFMLDKNGKSFMAVTPTAAV